MTWSNTVLRFSTESVTWWSHMLTSWLWEKYLFSSMVSPILKWQIIIIINNYITELLWASNIGGAYRTLSAPSKYSIKFGSVNKSNPFFLIIDDLVVGTWPTLWMERQESTTGKSVGVFADQTESLEESLFASACCWVWLWPLVPFFFQPEIKGNMRMTGQRWKRKQSFMAKISWLLYLSWI